MALIDPMVNTKLITAQEIAAREAIEQAGREVIHGEWAEKTEMAGFDHGIISLNVAVALRTYLKTNPLGKALADGVTYVLKGTPEHIEVMRLPDASFLSNEKLDHIAPQGYAYTAPNIAVEVISKTEKPGDTYDKMSDYFEYGTQQVWLIYPERHLVVVHFPDGTTQTYQEGDTLLCEAILPAFQLPLSDIFAL
jgi:Uma2 family endonuclease